MSDDDMHGLDHLDAKTQEHLTREAVGRYVAECVKAAKPVKPIHKTKVDAVEVVLEDDKGSVLARYPWVYDAMVGLARLK
jgi:hypothetical protein